MENEIPRRSFIRLAIWLLNGLIAAMLAIPGLGYLLTPVFQKGQEAWVKIGARNQFSGGAPQKAIYKYIAQSGYTAAERRGFAWVVPGASADNQLTVLSAVCTHTGCNVAWDSEEEKFVCPCHGGRYDSSGQVLSGPPPRPLVKLAIKTERGQLFIKIPA